MTRIRRLVALAAVSADLLACDGESLATRLDPDDASEVIDASDASVAADATADAHADAPLRDRHVRLIEPLSASVHTTPRGRLRWDYRGDVTVTFERSKNAADRIEVDARDGELELSSVPGLSRGAWTWRVCVRGEDAGAACSAIWGFRIERDEGTPPAWIRRRIFDDGLDGYADVILGVADPLPWASPWAECQSPLALARIVTLHGGATLQDAIPLSVYAIPSSDLRCEPPTRLFELPDMNGDGTADAVVCTTSGTCWWSPLTSRNELRTTRVVQLGSGAPTRALSVASLGDLDGDGYGEIALLTPEGVQRLRGTQDGPDLARGPIYLDRCADETRCGISALRLTAEPAARALVVSTDRGVQVVALDGDTFHPIGDPVASRRPAVVMQGAPDPDAADMTSLIVTVKERDLALYPIRGRDLSADHPVHLILDGWDGDAAQLQLAVGDFDANGELDLVAEFDRIDASVTRRHITTFLRRGGGFERPPDLETAAINPGVSPLIVRDFTNDGRDVLVDVLDGHLRRLTFDEVGGWNVIQGADVAITPGNGAGHVVTAPGVGEATLSRASGHDAGVTMK